MALEQYESSACESKMSAKCEAFVTRQKLCAWNYSRNWADEVAAISEYSKTESCITPAMAVFSELSEPSIELKISRNFANFAEQKVVSRFEHSIAGLGESVTRPDYKIRIGYVSFYFHDHIVGYIFETLLKLHDVEKFDIYLYVLNPPDSMSFCYFFFVFSFLFYSLLIINVEKEHGTRNKIKEIPKINFVDVSELNPSEVASRINDDGILVIFYLFYFICCDCVEILFRF